MPENEKAKVAEEFGHYVLNQQPFDNLVNLNTHTKDHLVVLETSGVPFTDALGNIQKVNQAFSRIIGYTASEAVVVSSLKYLTPFKQ